jgi:tetratricopeptide (TPR) repeat protein
MIENQGCGDRVSEEAEGPESGPEGIGGGIDPAAVALALHGASREVADAFLQDQRGLIQLQAKELSHELGLRHWSLWVRHFSGVLKLTLEVSLALVALALVGIAAGSVWNATHADGLVIESFSVPPDMAARGLTGQVVASQLLDKVSVVQSSIPGSTRPGRAASGSWGDDIKVEIPETGISVGEAWRFMRRWLGHETMVAGEVVRTQDGIAVTVRIDGREGATYAGPESGVDALTTKAAEHVIAVTQPALYGTYLMTRDVPRVAEAQAVLARAAGDTSRSPVERDRSWNDLALLYSRNKWETRAGTQMLRRALALVPDDPVARGNLVTSEIRLGHPESARAEIPAALSSFDHHASDYLPDPLIGIRARLSMFAAALSGDFAEAVRLGRTAADQISPGPRQAEMQRSVGEYLARQHDGAARAWLHQMPAPPTRPDRVAQAITMLHVAAALEDWHATLALGPAVDKALALPGYTDVPLITATQLRPLLALARAGSGDMAGAQALIATTPGDCYDCVRTRGKIAAASKQWGRADYWFARAAHQAPSIPFADTDWGNSLLQRGQPDAAIEKFKLAGQKGAHFADPLEGWGEALMAKNQSHLALAKFAEADKFAPNWGRLHLKWGEALGYAGKKDEAQKQYALAAGLDLTPGEKIELARQPLHG